MNMTKTQARTLLVNNTNYPLKPNIISSPYREVKTSPLKSRLDLKYFKRERSFHTSSILLDNSNNESLQDAGDKAEVCDADSVDIVTTVTTTPDITQIVSEPSIASLGLDGCIPIGLIRNVLEFGHVTLALPWWGSIVCLAMSYNIIIIPLELKLLKMSAIYESEWVRLQSKVGLSDEITGRGELQAMTKKYGFTPFIIYPLIPLASVLPVFALERLSFSIESFKTGGILWFTDLTAQDPYFILPILAFCAGNAFQPDTLKYKAGVINTILLISCDFFKVPCAIPLYWLTYEIFRLVQRLVLRWPVVRTYFGLPSRVEGIVKKKRH